jgi:hypothetical protein
LSGAASFDGANDSDAGGSGLTVLNFGGLIYDEWFDSSPAYSEYDQGWVSQNIICHTTTCFNLQGIFDVTGPNPSVPLRLNLRLDCQNLNCTQDFSQNGTLSLSLPAGVTYTSDSGVFLTSSSTPEPASFSLVALGGMLEETCYGRGGRA